MVNRSAPVQAHPVEYDAIVVGSGIMGDLAAKELCEGGLKTPANQISFGGSESRAAQTGVDARACRYIVEEMKRGNI